MSIFLGKGALRLIYKEATTAQLTAATSKAAAYAIMKFTNEGRLCLISNGTAADISVAAVHPDADPTVDANRLFLFEIPAFTPLNLDSVNFTVEVGTVLYVWNSGGQAIVSPTKLRIIGWG